MQLDTKLIEEILAEATTKIVAIHNLPDLEQIRLSYLGKKGVITEYLQKLNSVSPELKPQLGQLINQLKSNIQVLLNNQKNIIEEHTLTQALMAEKLDVTLPGRKQSFGSLHPITLMMQRIENFFLKLGFEVADGPEVEDEYHNFEALNIPDHHPARAMHDTFYFEDGRLLRTHTSPVQIRYLEREKPPIRMLAPGKVYRHDYDVTHIPMFHQVEGLVIDENASFSHLKGLLQTFINDFFERSIKTRFRPSYFPFTEPSAEVDIECVHCLGQGCRICKDTGWLEVLGCGMVHPNVLRNVGMNPEIYRGYAFGLGVDRLAMLKYKVDDIRVFLENDIRFLNQF